MFTSSLIIVCVFTGLIHFAEATASCLRIAGVRTKQVATSLSFVNASLLVSRLSNMLQAPFLGGMVDTAILLGAVTVLQLNFRFIIFAAFIGNLVAMVLAPFSVFLFTKAIYRFEQHGSVPRILLSIFRPRNFWKIVTSFKLPSIKHLKDLSWHNLPKGFLILNCLMASIYCIGVLSSMLAGALVPSYRVTATQLSAIVNGMATILFTLMVDPAAARITDQAIKGKRPEADVRAMVFYLLLGRVVGILILSQLFLWPAAEYIKDVTLLVQSAFAR
ncbi:MAG: lipid II flippase Amj family protein [Candidatus Saganbacteria bacterium]|nr:lipid II flippase Amj family protein [Candidatus Saganbacteria bacterium]